MVNFCPNCGMKIANENAQVCLSCGVLLYNMPIRPKFYSSGFVLGILSLCIPMHGLFLGVIGLPMACISKRKSSIIMNSVGIVVWGGLMAFMFSNIPPHHGF